MSLQATEPRQHVSVLTNGWRFTLPTPIRKARGWAAGTRLLARIRGASLVITAGDSAALSARDSQTFGLDEQPAMSTNGNLARDTGNGDIPPVECYLGSGGKIVLPVSLRRHLGWVIGKKVVIVDEGDSVALTLCCDAKRCESCMSISGVQEIIPNVYLCKQCWYQYLRAMNSKLKLGRVKV